MGKRGTRAAMEHRRAIVRSLMARGMEQHEILHQLSTDKRYCEEHIMKNGEPIENPNFCGNVKTGDPISKSTLSRDWNAILEQWQEESVMDVGEHFARQLAEIKEAKRVAQAAKDRKEFRELLKLEIHLLGTAKPQKLEHSWNDEQLGKVDRLKGLFQGMRQREVANGHSDS